MKTQTKHPTHFISRIIFLFSVFCFLNLPLSFSASGMREIKVGVAVTDNVKTRPDWKETFLRRLAYASRIFETEFKIKFVPTVFWQWRPADERRDVDYLIEDLKSTYPLDGVDIVVGLSRLDQIKRLEEYRDLEVLGRAQPFSGYILIRLPEKQMFKIQEETVLVHELGHLFGAIHVGDGNSIMAPYVDRQIPSQLDPTNREIIKLARDIDFNRGMQAIDASAIQQLIYSYIRLATSAQSFDFFYALGAFYVKLGQFEEALNAWKKAAQVDDKSPQIHYDLGVLYSKMENYDGAISELSRATTQFSHPSQRDDKIKALMMLGSANFRRGNAEGAYRAWSDLLVVDPNNFQARMNLATLKLQNGQIDSAISDFEQLLKIEPNAPTILSNLGAAYFQKKEYHKAIEYLKRVLQLSPRQTVGGSAGSMDPNQPSEIYKHLALSYMAIGQTTNAVEYLRLSCQINPTVECHQKLGELYFQLGKWNEVIGELAGVVQIQKDDPAVYGMLGVALFQKGEHNQALGVFEEGVKHARDNNAAAQFYQNIGNLYLQSHQYDQSALAFQKAISYQWNNANSHFGLALVYLSQNRLDDARYSLKSALQINPDHASARELLARVDGAAQNQNQRPQVERQGSGALVH